MTRDDINKAAIEHFPANTNREDAKVQGFIRGAEWGQKEMIDKACEWLKENLYECTKDQEFIGTLCKYIYKKDVISQFCKAMAE